MLDAHHLDPAERARIHPRLIGLLIVFIALAALSFYVGFLQPRDRFDWRSQAAFLVLTFMLIPVVVFTLTQQAGAVGRLEAHGTTPHPAVRHVLGITAGQCPAPVWVFTSAVEDAARLDFYDDPATRPGWEISQRGATMLVLRQGDARLSVSATSTGRIIYMLRP